MTVELLYLDSSAILKLIVRERESSALRERLLGDVDLVSSDLARVEVGRALMRLASTARTRLRAETILGGIGLIRIDGEILERAAALRPAELRSLDAIHLASAMSTGSMLTALVTYDGQMAAAAAAAGLPVVAPR